MRITGRVRSARRGLAILGGLLAALLAALAVPAGAHEYWIAPEAFTVPAGGRIEARLMVGQELRGTELPWLSRQVRSFRLAGPEGVREIEGREGDLPAIGVDAAAAGLHVLAHETVPLPASFGTLAEFRDYLEYEGLGGVAGQHVRRGLPETGITEAYARAAKALVQVGPVRPGEGDRRMGLDYELVALANPYAGAARLPVLLLWQGEPAAGAPVAAFREIGEAGDGDVERVLMRTDSDGRLEVPLAPGARYLLNAVHIEPDESEDNHWRSTWATLTFAVPPRQ